MITIKTRSGSTYHFDNEAMTWTRESDHDILFAPTGTNSGILRAPVEPRLGQRLTFFDVELDWVTTTPVQSIEGAPDA